MNEKKQCEMLTFVLILSLITLNLSIICAEGDKEKFNSFKLDPHIYSPIPEIRFIKNFNLIYYRDINSFCIKGWLYPSDKWDVNSTISFQFYIDPNYSLRGTIPESRGIPEVNLPLKEELSFLATDYSQDEWVNKTSIKDFRWYYDSSSWIHYKIDLNSNKKFYNALKEQNKSIYFEIYFDFNNCKINGTKLDLSGKKEIYLLLPAYKFQSSPEESVSFALKFEGKIIEDYNPEENIVIDDNLVKCTFDSPNYMGTIFYVHLTLTTWYEQYKYLLLILILSITIPSIIAILYQEYRHKNGKKTKLSIEFKPEKPFVIEEKTDKYAYHIHDSKWVRVKVKVGNHAARRCRGVLEEIVTETGEVLSRYSLTTLEWHNLPSEDGFVNLNKKDEYFLDVAFTVDSGFFFIVDNSLERYLPNVYLAEGVYILTVKVTAENADPVWIKLRIEWNEVWNELKVSQI